MCYGKHDWLPFAGTKRIEHRARLRSLAGPALGSLLSLPILMSCADASCPRGAIEVEPGTSIQAAVDSAGEGAAFCLKNGVHRIQVIRPKSGQSFHGEGQTVLSGSRLLTTFSREGRYWVAAGQKQRGRRHEEMALGLVERDCQQYGLRSIFLDRTRVRIEPG